MTKILFSFAHLSSKGVIYFFYNLSFSLKTGFLRALHITTYMIQKFNLFIPHSGRKVSDYTSLVNICLWFINYDWGWWHD